MPADWPIRLYGDDSWSLRVRFCEPGDRPGTAGASIDVSDRAYAAQVRSAEGRLLSTMTIDTTDAADGVITLRIPDGDIRELSGRWDLQETTGGDPPETHTLFAGLVTWVGDVTR